MKKNRLDPLYWEGRLLTDTSDAKVDFNEAAAKTKAGEHIIIRVFDKVPVNFEDVQLPFGASMTCLTWAEGKPDDD